MTNDIGTAFITSTDNNELERLKVGKSHAHLRNT
jgi:hypothetical protein